MSEKLTFIETIRSYLGIVLFFTLMLIATPIIFVLALLTFGKASNFIVRFIAPAIARPVLVVSGVKFSIKHHGEPFKKPAIYIINHSSTLDLVTMLAVGVERIRFVAKWELQYFPIFFIVGRLTGQVFIRRQDKKHAIPTLLKTYKRLQKHRLSIMLAPEGSRKHEGVIGPFKKGAFRMAVDLGYPIVPIYFEGNQQLSQGGFLLTKSGRATAHIHPPIDTSSWSQDTLNEHIEEVRSKYLEWAGVKE